jgi:hypothetical protein
MAQHIKIRRQQFSDEALAAYREFMEKVTDLAKEHDLDADTVVEELSYLYEPSEMWAVR